MVEGQTIVVGESYSLTPCRLKTLVASFWTWNTHATVCGLIFFMAPM